MSALPTANLSAQLQHINYTEYRLGSGVETEGLLHCHAKRISIRVSNSQPPALSPETMLDY